MPPTIFWDTEMTLTLYNKVCIWKRATGRDSINTGGIIVIIKNIIFLYRNMSFGGIFETAAQHGLYYPLVTDVETCNERLNVSLTQQAYSKGQACL